MAHEREHERGRRKHPGVERGLELLQRLGEEAAVQQTLHVPQVSRATLRRITTRGQRKGNENGEDKWNCLSVGSAWHCQSLPGSISDYRELCRGGGGRKERKDETLHFPQMALWEKESPGKPVEGQQRPIF